MISDAISSSSCLVIVAARDCVFFGFVLVICIHGFAAFARIDLETMKERLLLQPQDSPHSVVHFVFSRSFGLIFLYSHVHPWNPSLNECSDEHGGETVVESLDIQFLKNDLC